MAAAAGMTFDPQYIDHVLSENFEDAKALFLSPLLSINYAHLVMLADTAIVSADEAHALREALDAISVTDVRATPYNDTCEDLFFHIERLIERALRRGHGRAPPHRAQPQRHRHDDVPAAPAGIHPDAAGASSLKLRGGLDRPRRPAPGHARSPR